MTTRRIGLLVLVGALGGCQAAQDYWDQRTPEPVPLAAVWRSTSVDGHRIRRVLVMPVQDDTAEPGNVDSVQQSLFDALQRRQAFEVVPLPRDPRHENDQVLYARDGRIRMDLVRELAVRHHADGILMSSVTRNRCYEPMALGLRLSLISTGAGDLVWEASGLYDTQDARVTQDLHHWFDTEVADRNRLEGWRAGLMSPALFRSYVSARLVTTY